MFFQSNTDLHIIPFSMINKSNSLLEIDWWSCVLEDVFLLVECNNIFTMSLIFSLKLWASSHFILRNMICVFLRIVVPNAWESLDITLNGSLNLLYVTLIMMIKRPRIIDQVSRSHHFSLASCCSSHPTTANTVFNHNSDDTWGAFVHGRGGDGRYYWFASRLPISKYPLMMRKVY